MNLPFQPGRRRFFLSPPEGERERAVNSGGGVHGRDGRNRFQGTSLRTGTGNCKLHVENYK
jgi:hypothetical protein